VYPPLLPDLCHQQTCWGYTLILHPGHWWLSWTRLGPVLTPGGCHYTESPFFLKNYSYLKFTWKEHLWLLFCLQFLAWAGLCWKLLYGILCVEVLGLLIADALYLPGMRSGQFVGYFCCFLFIKILKLSMFFVHGINSRKYFGKSAALVVLNYCWVYRFYNHSKKPEWTKPIKPLLIYYLWVYGFWI